QERYQLANEAAWTFAGAVPGTSRAIVRTLEDVGVWDFETGDFTRWFPREPNTRAIRSMVLSPDGKLLAVLFSGGQVRLWDVGKKDWSDLALTYDDVYWLGHLLDHHVLHTTTESGEQLVWDVAKRQELY